MARTVDPARHEARRLVIIDAALTCFAANGFDRTGTADICRKAGIGSGTFFHYFPTKLAVLLAILEVGTAATAAWFAAQAQRTDAAAVVTDFVDHTAQACTDPRLPDFVKTVGGVLAEPRVAAALARDTATLYAGLLPWVEAGQSTTDIRADVPAPRLCTWIAVVLDGFFSRLAEDNDFDAAAERDMLVDTVRRLLAP